MRRHCDGTDPNLTRDLAQAEPGELKAGMSFVLSPWDAGTAGGVVVNCNCGLVFDDAERRVVYPHEPVGS